MHADAEIDTFSPRGYTEIKGVDVTMEYYQAAVCEDHPGTLGLIRSRLEEVFRERKLPVALDARTDPRALLKSVAEGRRYDLLFLDIDMPGINGIELCRRLRADGSQALVTFVSGKEELVFQTFEVQPFRFVRKNHFMEELPQLADDICRELRGRTETSVVVAELHSQRIFTFGVQSLIYVEALAKACRFVTASGETVLNAKLMELEEQLSPHGFIRCHRSYLVNCRYIFSIQKDSVILDDRTVLPVSRSRAAPLREAFFAYVNGGSV